MLDPGHGGSQACGGASPLGVVGVFGLAEKELTLELAQRAAARPPEGMTVVLTRDADQSLSLAERAQVSRNHGARAFVSVHFNGCQDRCQQATEVFVHEHASAPSRRLAEAVRASVSAATGHPSADIVAAPLAVLTPQRHAVGAACCAVEVSYLTDPAEEERLGNPLYRERLAQALTDALATWERTAQGADAAQPEVVERGGQRRSFDIWHEVPLVPQLTGMSCWAAAAAMVIGWREGVPVDPDEVARGAGRWAAYADGLLPEDVHDLARAWELHVEAPATFSVADLRALLEARGPLWIGEADPGLHVVVIAGIYGDGSAEGTYLRINDPWPIGQGERYTLRFSDLRDNFRAARHLGGVHAQVLHAGARAARAAGARVTTSTQERWYVRRERSDPSP